MAAPPGAGARRVLTLGQIRAELAGEDHLRHSIPLVAPVEHADRDWAMDPYLLGINLGSVAANSTSAIIAPTSILSSVASRLALFQGLLDMAGDLDGVGRVRVLTASPLLAGSLAQLVMSLGGTAVRLEAADGRHEVALALPAGLAPFRASDKGTYVEAGSLAVPSRAIARVERVGVKPAQCIRVEAADHL